MSITPNGPAPYPPAGQVTAVIEHHRKQGLPTPVTTDVITRVTNTPGLSARVIKALHLFELIDDDGQPTAQFDELAKAPSEGVFKERFAETLRAAYADVFLYIDPLTASYEQIEGQFRHYTPRGQLARMVALFRGLCEYAEITPAGVGEPPSAPAKPRATRSAPKVKGQPKPKIGNPPSSGRPSQSESRIEALTDAKARYIDLLLKQAENSPDEALFNRIEKVLGLATVSAPAEGRGDNARAGGESD